MSLHSPTSAHDADGHRGRYTAIFERLWTHPEFLELGPIERLTLIALKASLPMSGIDAIAPMTLLISLADRVGVPHDDKTQTIETALTRLEAAGFIKRAGRTVWLLNGLRWEPNVGSSGSMSSKIASGITRQVSSLRQECPVVAEFWKAYGASLGRTESPRIAPVPVIAAQKVEVPPRQKKAATETEKTEKKEPNNWPAKISAAWEDVTGGLLTPAEAGRVAKALVAKHGEEDVLRAWDKYLENQIAQFRSLTNFIKNYGLWTGHSLVEDDKENDSYETTLSL